MGKAPTKETLQSVADNFQDSVNHTLDELMTGGKAAQEELSAGYREAHLLAKGAAGLPVSALKAVSIDVKDLVMDGDPYSRDDVLAKFRELGFKTQGGRIFYDHPRIGEEKPVPPPAPFPTKADEVRLYVETNFVSDIMYAKDMESFEDGLSEYNSQNEYNQDDRSYKPAPVELADFKALSISAIFASDSTAREYHKPAEFSAKLKELGFVVNGDRIEGHKSALSPKPSKATTPQP